MRFFKDTRGIRKRANRPHGRLSTENKRKEMLENVEEYVEKIKRSGVVGITLTGGLSRGYGDELSEIDLDIYLTPELYKKWIMGKGPLPHGDHLGTRYHMDVSFLDYEKESEIEWDLQKKWDSSYAIILHDPHGKIRGCSQRKTSSKPRRNTASRLVTTSTASTLRTSRYVSGAIEETPWWPTR